MDEAMDEDTSTNYEDLIDPELMDFTQNETQSQHQNHSFPHTIPDSQPEIFTICLLLSPNLGKDTMQAVCSYLHYTNLPPTALKADYRQHLYLGLRDNPQDIARIYHGMGSHSGLEKFWRTFTAKKHVPWKWRALGQQEMARFDLVGAQDLEGAVVADPLKGPTNPPNPNPEHNTSTSTSFSQLKNLINDFQERQAQRQEKVEHDTQMLREQMDFVVDKLEEMERHQPELDAQLYTIEFTVTSAIQNSETIDLHTSSLQTQQSNILALTREVAELRNELQKLQRTGLNPTLEGRLNKIESKQIDLEKKENQHDENIERMRKSHNLVIWNLPEIEGNWPIRTVLGIIRELGLATITTKDVTVRRIQARNGSNMHTITFQNTDTMEEVLRSFRRTQRDRRKAGKQPLPYSMDRDKTLFQQRLDRITHYKALYLAHRNKDNLPQTYVKWDDGRIAVYNSREDTVPAQIMSQMEVADIEVDSEYAKTHPLPRGYTDRPPNPPMSKANATPLGTRTQEMLNHPTTPNQSSKEPEVVDLVESDQPSMGNTTHAPSDPDATAIVTRPQTPPPHGRNDTPAPSPSKRKRTEPDRLDLHTMPNLSPKKQRQIMPAPRPTAPLNQEQQQPLSLRENWNRIKARIDSYQQSRAQGSSKQTTIERPSMHAGTHRNGSQSDETESEPEMEVDAPAARGNPSTTNF